MFGNKALRNVFRSEDKEVSILGDILCNEFNDCGLYNVVSTLKCRAGF